MSDLVGDYIIKKPVQAVQLDDAATIARVGRWMTENGANCGWVSASGAAALVKAGQGANRIWLYEDKGEKSESIGIGDWVVRVSDHEFLLVSAMNFANTYEAKPAAVQGELEE